MKLLLVRACDVDGVCNGGTVVAVDAVGAGVGEIVLYASGSSARQTTATSSTIAMIVASTGRFCVTCVWRAELPDA